MKVIKILSIVGARPNFMKIASIQRAIADYNSLERVPCIEHVIIHTGQHYDEQMSGHFFSELGLPKPAFNLGVGSGSHALQTAQIMERFEPVLLSQHPDVLLVVGDVNSTVACALVAVKVRYEGIMRSRPLIAHVEAGLRSFDRDMPEEVNRVLTDALSDLLFITEDQAQVNLVREGVSKQKIHFVGNVMIDTLISHLEKAKAVSVSVVEGILGQELDNGYGVATLHRPSNVDDPEKLAALVDCLDKIAVRLPIVFSVHPRTRSNLEKFGLYETLIQSKRVILTESLGYLPFIKLLSSATLVVTDSGGIQEETTFLRVPCITMRNNTERPITITCGTNHLVGDGPAEILKTAYSILEGKSKKGTVPPLWDGKAGARIVEIVVSAAGA
jgi:UDP-N-acetylglucosamine 2-epimerase (non-hydrolysing)